MKYLFLLATLLLLIQSTTAQVPRQPVWPDSLSSVLPTPPATPDTIAALHRLFAAKRKKLKIILLGTAAAEVAGQVITSSTVQSGSIIDDRAISQFFVAVLAVPVVLAEVLFYSQYNQAHEHRAMDKFQSHQLPPHLKRQLKAKYFH